jgi:hypothetical protein
MVSIESAANNKVIRAAAVAAVVVSVSSRALAGIVNDRVHLSDQVVGYVVALVVADERGFGTIVHLSRCQFTAMREEGYC